jgi:hypothetical protein
MNLPVGEDYDLGEGSATRAAPRTFTGGILQPVIGAKIDNWPFRFFKKGRYCGRVEEWFGHSTLLRGQNEKLDRFIHTILVLPGAGVDVGQFQHRQERAETGRRSSRMLDRRTSAFDLRL